ncbi:hypothetical protein GGH92_008370, partial [Coemansia sp. RSA 2673]
NKFDIYGKQCPLRTRTGDLCPQLCVSDVALCPRGYGNDKCSAGEKLCVDGSCSSACGDIPARNNPCGCAFQYPPIQAAALVPCAAFPEVTIDHYNAADLSQTIDYCTDRFSISGTVPIWGQWDVGQNTTDDLASNGDGHRFWAGKQCPKVPKYHYTYNEPLWLGVFACAGAEALVLLIWSTYKHFCEVSVRRLRRQVSGFKTASAAAVAVSGGENPKNLSDTMEKRTSGASKTSSMATSEDNELRLKGFKTDALGCVGFVSVLAMTLGWFVILGFWTGDYYGTLGQSASLAHYSSALLDETFIPIWIFATTWLTICCTFKDRIRNYFRIECSPAEGTYVQIERELKETRLAANSSSLFVLLAKRAEEHFC